MNKDHKMIFTTSIFLAFTSMCIADDFIYYTTQKNDYLSKILFSLDVKPIYGKRGALREVVALNKDKLKDNGDFVALGTVIVIPVKVIKKIPAAINVEEQKEQIVAEKKSETESVDALSNSDTSLSGQYSYFKISPVFSYLAINSTDDSRFGGVEASNTSKPSYGARGEWNMMITPELGMNIHAGIDFLSFYKDNLYALTDTSFQRKNFGIGSVYNFNSDSKIIADLEVNQNYFFEIVNPTNVQIRELTQVEIKAKFSKNIFKFGKAKSDLGIGALYMLASSGQNKSKAGLGGLVDWTTRFNNKEIQLSYIYKTFKVNSTENVTNEVVARFNFDFGYQK